MTDVWEDYANYIQRPISSTIDESGKKFDIEMIDYQIGVFSKTLVNLRSDRNWSLVLFGLNILILLAGVIIPIPNPWMMLPIGLLSTLSFLWIYTYKISQKRLDKRLEKIKNLKDKKADLLGIPVYIRRWKEKLA